MATEWVADPVNQRWVGPAGTQAFAGTGGPQVVLGPVVYTTAEINSWSTGHAEYTRLANDNYGNLANSAVANIVDFGTSITTSGNRINAREQGAIAKVQAVLWAADGNASRLAKVQECLDAIKDVTTYSVSAGQDNLEAGWFATNYCQAAAIIGYSNAAFDTFLRDLIYDMLDWTTGGNWLMAFADSRLAIASYLEDFTLWEDAKDYLEWAVPRTIYHSTYDSGSVVGLTGTGGWPAKATGTNTTWTYNHWGGEVGFPQLQSGSYVAEYPPGTPFPNGTDAERRRDLGHQCQSISSMAHGLLTILACSDTVPQHIIDRFTAFCSYHGGRVLTYVQTGSLPTNPVPENGSGGAAHLKGWHPAAHYFDVAGLATPADVTSLLAESNVQNADAGGGNQQVAEHFADGSLL